MARTEHPRFGLRRSAIFIAALLAFPVPSSAYDTPLSDTAIREAYFLGQRHDESTAKFLDKYTKYFGPPKFGPQISSITLFTPFAQVVQQSDWHSVGYSAQQAQLDHNGTAESIKIIIQIQFTESYGAFIPAPGGSRSGSSTGFMLRPYDFWTDFQVQIFDREAKLKPASSSGRANFQCSENGGCTLNGATITTEFPATAFDSDSATIQIDPPEGEQFVVDFDLTSLR